MTRECLYLNMSFKDIICEDVSGLWHTVMWCLGDNASEKYAAFIIRVEELLPDWALLQPNRSQHETKPVTAYFGLLESDLYSLSSTLCVIFSY